MASADWTAVKHVLDDRRTGKGNERFPDHGISKPKAKRLCAALGIKMPRAGYEVGLTDDPDGNHWYLVNIAGSSFYLRKYYR